MEQQEQMLKVCRKCLMAIECHEGSQITQAIAVDEEDETESKCDWCEESGFDTLYIVY